MAKPEITVLLCVQERPAEVASTLIGLALQTYHEFSLFIQDESQNISLLNDQHIVKLLDLLALKGIRVFYTRDWDSRGGCYAFHKAMSLVSSGYLWLLGQDVIPEPECLAKLWETMVQKDCGWVQGLKLNIDNGYGFMNFQHRVIHDVAVEDISKLNMYYSYSQDVVVPQTVGDSANLLINREKLLAVGGFSFYRELFVFGSRNQVPAEDWIATILTSDKYGGNLRTGAVAWHATRNMPSRASEFILARKTVLQFIRNKVAPQTYEKVLVFLSGLDEMSAGEARFDCTDWAHSSSAAPPLS